MNKQENILLFCDIENLIVSRPRGPGARACRANASMRPSSSICLQLAIGLAIAAALPCLVENPLLGLVLSGALNVALLLRVRQLELKLATLERSTPACASQTPDTALRVQHQQSLAVPLPRLNAVEAQRLARGETVLKSIGQGGDGKEGLAAVMIEAPAELVWATLLDFGSWPSMVDNVTAADVYESVQPPATRPTHAHTLTAARSRSATSPDGGRLGRRHQGPRGDRGRPSEDHVSRAPRAGTLLRVLSSDAPVNMNARPHTRCSIGSTTSSRGPSTLRSPPTSSRTLATGCFARSPRGQTQRPSTTRRHTHIAPRVRPTFRSPTPHLRPPHTQHVFPRRCLPQARVSLSAWAPAWLGRFIAAQGLPRATAWLKRESERRFAAGGAWRGSLRRRVQSSPNLERMGRPAGQWAGDRAADGWSTGQRGGGAVSPPPKLVALEELAAESQQAPEADGVAQAIDFGGGGSAGQQADGQLAPQHGLRPRRLPRVASDADLLASASSRSRLMYRHKASAFRHRMRHF